MLVPVSGNVDPAELNRRSLPNIPKSLRDQDPRKFPPVYIFNVGPRKHEFPPNERGARFLEACPKGQPYSKPLVFRNIEMEVYDLADGGGNMGLLQEEGLDKALALIHGGPSGAGLSIDTPNLEWLGVFVTENAEPTKRELADAREKANAMQRLIYDQGSEALQQGTKVPPGDRSLYNEAAALLGKPPLFGVADHTMERCLFCKNTILEGAIICTHCHSRLDTDEAKKLRIAKAS